MANITLNLALGMVIQSLRMIGDSEKIISHFFLNTTLGNLHLALILERIHQVGKIFQRIKF
jgi:hypothetical protein